MDEESWLELLDLYTEIVEKQDEIIFRMGKIIARQAQDLQLVRNDREFSDPKLDQDMAIMEEVRHDYEGYTKP